MWGHAEQEQTRRSSRAGHLSATRLGRLECIVTRTTKTATQGQLLTASATTPAIAVTAVNDGNLLNTKDVLVQKRPTLSPLRRQ